MLNIPSTVVDSNYRYRMPKMQLKIESKGNGIKTNIVNLQDVAKHLRTDEGYILKFFGFQKASQTIQKSSQTKSNKQAKSNTSYIIQGSFTDEDLLKVLDKFIDKYILCPKCKLPQLNLYLINDRINGKCDSCPFNGQLDNKHKLTAYILKNPPTYKPQAIKATKVIQNQNKNQQKKQTNDKQQTRKKSDNYANQAKVQQQSQQKATNLFSAQNLQFGSPEMEKLVQYTKKYIQARKEKDQDIMSAQIVNNFKPLGLKKALFAYLLFNGFFTVNIAIQAKQNSFMYKKLMKRLVGGSDQSMQTQTLLNLQYLFLQVYKQKDFTQSMYKILYKLYEAEMLSKEFLLKWSSGQIKDFQKYFLYNEARNESFLKMTQKLIDTLKEESDDSGEEEEQKKEKS